MALPDTSSDLPGLSPTPRTRPTRSRERAVAERAALHDLLADALVAHLGVTVERDTMSHPLVLPVAFGFDLDGPDEGGSLYLHGSVAAGWLRSAIGATVCVSFTELDGLVLARSGMHHSMNYRSAVVIGALRKVEDATERARALDLVVDQMVPGRAATLRAATRKELAATVVLAVPLIEASVKVRGGPPNDDPADVGGPAWAGHVPVRRTYAPAVTAADSAAAVPADVAALLDH